MQALGPGCSHGWRDDGLFLTAKQPAFTCMRVQASHSHVRCPAQCGAQGMVRDAQGLQDIVKRHRLNGLAERHVNADQHGFKLVVCQHHANRHFAHRFAQKRGSFGLQHLGVACKAGSPATRCTERLFVDRRGDHACGLTRQYGTRRPDNALGRCKTRQTTDLAITYGGCQLTFL